MDAQHGIEAADRPLIGVLGSANMDLVVRVDHPPRPGETLFGDSFVTVPGGKGLNQAVATARAGGNVAFIGSVGQDSFGDELGDLLEAAGIAAEGLRRVPGTTGTAHITVDAAGENSIIVVSAANRATTADQLHDDLLERMAWLVTQLELPLEEVARALSRARARGVRTVLTPAPARALDRGLLGDVDLLVPNQLEACALAGVSDPAAAAVELSRTCQDVVVTLGAAGAVWARDGTLAEAIPGRRADVVDTTGAGDTFVGYLVALLAEGLSVSEALSSATQAAAIAVSRPGATASMPYRAELRP